ncbi:cation:proton antiporter [Streptomyces mutabilis]|uniref:cation:proton antiporter domain-containing protein n=1 Tax=Streptomyces mutabilis TaxID=67332 RepID=UPI002FD2F791
MAMAPLLSGRRPAESAALLVAFGVVTAGAVFWALRPRPRWFGELTERTLHSSGQFAVRFVMLLACMLGLAEVFGPDVLLGAFAAGVLTRLVLRRAVPEAGEEVVGKVEAMGFGFLVPLFYVVTGIEFDLDALLHDPVALSPVPVFLVLCLVVRGGPVYVLAPKDLRRADRTALAPVRVDVPAPRRGDHDDRRDQGLLGTDRAAALVGAAMISVLVLPLLATRLRKASGGAVGGECREPRPARGTADDTEAW